MAKMLNLQAKMLNSCSIYGIFGGEGWFGINVIWGKGLAENVIWERV